MRNILLVFILFCFKISFSQNISGDIEIYLNNLIEDLPGSSGDDFQSPNTADLNSWNNMLNEIFATDLESARSFATLFNYQITDILDTTLQSNNRFYIIEEKAPQTNYWGTYVLSTDALRSNLIIQAPHPEYDINTGYQAIYCFKRLIPNALFISGTHRCNHSEYSDCSGTSTVCGPSSPYRISDNAHTTNSVFQETTEFLLQKSSTSVFVQLHGFGKRSTDPYVIMSNGTRITPEIDYVTLIQEGLEHADPSLTFRNAHIDLSWSRLIAFTNTQGRLINGSQNPCYENPTNSVGRFVHIEQERTKLRSDEDAWSKMHLALEEVFSIDTITTGVASYQKDENIIIFPNPNNGQFQVKLERNSRISIFNNLGSIVYEYQNSEPGRISIDLKDQPPGFYYLKVFQKDEIFHSKFVIVKH
jgi:hypothetical protein